jgi:hypothetical protein
MPLVGRLLFLLPTQKMYTHQTQSVLQNATLLRNRFWPPKLKTTPIFRLQKSNKRKLLELERGANLKVFGEILPFLLRQAFTTDF